MFMDSGRIVGHPELTRVRGPGGRPTSALPVIHPQSLAQLRTSRLPGTNPANFLEARLWTVSGLPPNRESSLGVRVEMLSWTTRFALIEQPRSHRYARLKNGVLNRDEASRASTF